MPCRADALALGIVAAALWGNCGFRKWLNANTALLYSLLCAFLVGVLGIAAWFPSHESLPTQTVGYSWIAIFYFLILLLVLSRPVGPVARIARVSWLRELGRVSYCLYIVHTGVRLLCHVFIVAVLNNRVSSWEGIAGNVLAAAASYGIARMSWIYFERPLLQCGHMFNY